MYSIEYKHYHKGKRINPILETEIDCPKDINYVRENIKSLTIDLEDINYIVCDYSLGILWSFFAVVNRNRDKLGNMNAITILNIDDINAKIILKIINCGWMINREENDKMKIADEAYKLMRIYKETRDPMQKMHIGKLVGYYINTIMYKFHGDKESVKTIKYGRRFCPRNEGTTR